ncbi:multinuclear nonheme iron-dependent oxidase [Nitrospira sp. Ecomares 2.1]
MRYTDLSRGEAIYEDFLRRAGRIPFLGLGLSVDVYSPDIFDLYEELRSQQIPMAYLEIFHAASEALAMVRARLSDIPLAYHAEGIWVTQPDWDTAYNSQERLQATAFNLRMLQPHWVNQECAAKEIGGFSFGTYLPPVFTRASAEITAYQTWNAQLQLDQFDWGQQVSSPLLLLEVPPLTYFSMGEMPYAEFFANISAKSPCGLVLDLGHVWTAYRYSGAWRKQGLESFFEAFLEQFPLERVIEIHIAGLDCHPNIHTGLDTEPHGPQNWIDAHEAPIPDELLMLLTRVLGDSRLLNLKGIALEVDNKPIPLICREMKMVMEMVEPPGHLIAQVRSSATELQRESNFPVENVEPSRETRDGLTLQYREYMALVREVLSGRLDVPGSLDAEMNMGLHVYATQYLPYEILTWGGDVRVMFPNACDLLAQYGISLKQFVEFWFAHPRTSESGIEYDFFLLKIDLFVKFIGQIFPEASSLVKQEAELLIQGYLLASQGAST